MSLFKAATGRLSLSLLFCSLFFFFCQAFPQVPKNKEDSLRTYCKHILSRSNQSEREASHKKLTLSLINLLRDESSWLHPFDSLSCIAVLQPPDKTFRLFNWEFPQENGTYQYGCIVQYPPVSGICRVTELEDIRMQSKNPEKVRLSGHKWIGAHYYQIVQKQFRRKKTYLLIGIDWNDRVTRKKIIEPAEITPTGELRLGGPVFAGKWSGQQRVIFEYAADLSMSLRYQEKKDQIIFDHLSPTSSDLTGQYAFYGPDLSYDALVFRKGKWKYLENIDARNDK